MGPYEPVTKRHEGDELESSGQKMSTPLVEELTFPELYNGLMGKWIINETSLFR